MELNPGYLKCILRRAELHDKTEKLDEALVDYQKVLEIDPSIYSARQACMVSFIGHLLAEAAEQFFI
jgi:predicted TPR repeat methyltransferase